MTRPRTLMLAGVLGLLLLVAGCFETTLNLGSADSAKVDAAYVGDWKFTVDAQGQTKPVNLVIRNFDGRRYYAEWTQEGEKPARMSAFFVPIKSATFAQLTGLEDDGTIPDKHLIVRVEVADGKLTIRHLNGNFFEGTTTDEAFRKRIEENLENAEMYGDTMNGTKAP